MTFLASFSPQRLGRGGGRNALEWAGGDDGRKQAQRSAAMKSVILLQAKEGNEGVD